MRRKCITNRIGNSLRVNGTRVCDRLSAKRGLSFTPAIPIRDVAWGLLPFAAPNIPEDGTRGARMTDPLEYHHTTTTIGDVNNLNIGVKQPRWSRSHA
jgi:hypothetical protein